MSNKRIVNFTTCVRNSSIYDDRVIKLLIGFVPTEDECESLSMEPLRNTELATREKEHADEIINYLKDIEANYPGIMFDEPVLAYMGVEYFDGREFFGVFEFNICGAYAVPDGENLTDSEIRKMIDNIVFEHCEIHLH